jgi:long-chain acyl-CoA synthetase
LALKPEDRVFVPVSMLHSYGFDLGLLAPLLVRCTIIVSSRFATTLLEETAEAKATVFLGIPKIYRMLVRLRRRPPDLSCLRWMLSCTAPLPTRDLLEFHDRYGIVLTQHYGTSETGALTNHIPAEVLRRPDSVGLPVHGVSIQILDDLGAGTGGGLGFVAAKSKAVAVSYVDSDTKKNEEGMGYRVGFFAGGYRTRDVGFVDGDGYLYLKPKNRAPGKERFIFPEA